MSFLIGGNYVMDYGNRLKEIQAKLTYLSAQESIYYEAEKLLKKELASIEDQKDELTRELLAVMEILRKS
jgi:hypothetical protein